MKCLIIMLVIVLIRTELVTSDIRSLDKNRNSTSNKPSNTYMNNTMQENSKTNVEKDGYTLVPTYGVWLLGITIGLLFLIVLSLLAVIYRLKYKAYSESIGDNIRITDTECRAKYDRQLSPDTTEVTVTRENSNDDNKFKLLKQGSKLVIADYPTTNVNNENISAESPVTPNLPTTTPKVNKIIHTQIGHMQQEQIRRICEGVLQKAQRLTESNSLSNLDNILNESCESENEVTIDKSASSPFLDVAEDFKELKTPLLGKKVLPSPSSAKKLSPSPSSANKLSSSPSSAKKFSPSPSTSNKFLPSPIPVKKLEDISNCTLKSGDDSSIQKERKYLPLHLPPFNKDKTNDASSLLKEDIYDNPPNNKKTMVSNECDDKKDDKLSTINRAVLHTNGDDEHLDDIYDNPPATKRPVFQANDHDEHANDVYDNPPKTNRPVLRRKSDNEHDVEDVYDNLPSNRPITAYDAKMDCIYDDLQSNSLARAKAMAASSSRKKSSTNEDLNDYDCPKSSGRGVRVDNNTDTGYLYTLTNDTDPNYFDSCYSNAKSYKQ